MMHGPGHILAEKSTIFPFMACKNPVSLLLASCTLGLDVGQKTGALLNNSDTAVLEKGRIDCEDGC